MQWANNHFGGLISRKRAIRRAIDIVVLNDLSDQLVLDIHRLIVLKQPKTVPLAPVLPELLLGR